MFKKFSRKNKITLPDYYEELEKYENKDKYFGRNQIWNWLNDENIYLVEINNALRHVTMDPWYQHIFLSAEGNTTFKEFVLHTARQYTKKEGIPESLDVAIIECFEELINNEHIKIADSPFQLEINKKLSMDEFARFNNL